MRLHHLEEEEEASMEVLWLSWSSYRCGGLDRATAVGSPLFLLLLITDGRFLLDWPRTRSINDQEVTF